MTQPLKPRDVVAERGAGEVQITWSDGHVSRYPMRYLRGHCPCAGCQGHGGGHVFHEGLDAKVTDMQLVGGYAIAFSFSDGHDTGIYTFEFLRELCPCEEHSGSGIGAEAP